MLEGIKLVRVDFRLIHGQVVTKWSNTVTAKTIVVVNDELSEDEFMADIYVMAAPPGIQVEVQSITSFVESAQGGSYDQGSVLVLFKNIEDVRRVAEQGVKFAAVQIGGLGAAGNKTSVVKGISIDRDDADHLLYLKEQGAEVSFQVTPEEARLPLDKALKKLGV
ncbi:PTS system mannose/fructose/N-acetylgalactosamine-transporter subunit IIB [Paenibacillus senegalimassiliensis]|uniref:PTS system mannose/fructose/N-acetylgalactosamine-transporter subunit IIB n=1 Tax=Paenibacillus senegalimassiliensis TaxID=1737426 RepID=UPI00073F37A6|nr:PTS sugar transporter subunit IIB [Paenibacillus senegalimassiliensis]